jgi:hypothetical protein
VFGGSIPCVSVRVRLIVLSEAAESGFESGAGGKDGGVVFCEVGAAIAGQARSAKSGPDQAATSTAPVKVEDCS